MTCRVSNLEQILERYVAETDPAKRRELLKSWLNAGGRELIDDAVADGLKSLRRPENDDT